MKLVRNPSDSPKQKVIHFTIEGSNPEALEATEEALKALECDYTIGGKTITWAYYCDRCPCYEDGYSSGFWINLDDVEDFKAAYKSVKR